MNKKLYSAQHIRNTSPYRRLNQYLEIPIETLPNKQIGIMPSPSQSKSAKDKNQNVNQTKKNLSIEDPQQIQVNKGKASIYWGRYKTQPYQLHSSPYQLPSSSYKLPSFSSHKKTSLRQSVQSLSILKRKTREVQEDKKRKKQSLEDKLKLKSKQERRCQLITSILNKYKDLYQTETQTININTPCIFSYKLSSKNICPQTKPKQRDKQASKKITRQYLKEKQYIEEKHKSMFVQAFNQPNEISPWNIEDHH